MSIFATNNALLLKIAPQQLVEFHRFELVLHPT